jgi:hypothetical protein
MFFIYREIGDVISFVIASRFGLRRWKIERKYLVTYVGKFGDIEI